MKNSKEYLIANNINPAHPDVNRIHKLVEKHPNYEFFFLKSRFGKEAVSIEEIENVFRTIQEKNIKISKSVDHFVRYIVISDFEQKILLDGEKEKIKKFKYNEDVSDIYRFIYKENRMYVDQRTNFEAFSDEVRDNITKLNANKIIQQFPAAGKKVVDNLDVKEKKEFYFNLHNLLETNTSYLTVKFAKYNNGDREVIMTPGKKISKVDYEKLPAVLKNNFNEIIDKPLQAFIKKSARYKSKESLFADLNAALYSLSGDEEYKKTVELIEDTEGAILEGLNPEKGIVVASALNSAAYSKIGGKNTSHCIARSEGTFSNYQKFGGKQYLIVNTKLPQTDDYRIIGLTIDGKGKITAAHTKSDSGILGSVSDLLKKWGVTKYVNPMSPDEIIEMLYFIIEDESVFNNQERAEIVIEYLPRLDTTRYDKKKMIHLLRYTKSEDKMKEIIKMSLDMRNSTEFLANYDYLANNILKVVTDDKQAHEMVMCFVKEYNTTVGLSKEDCMNMLLNKSKYVQPNRLIEIVGKKKFIEFVGAYSWEQEEKILRSLPQLFIYFLRDRETDGREIKLILESMYSYEKRDDIRKIVLKKMNDSGHLKKISRNEMVNLGILDKIEKDDKKLADSIPNK